MILKEKISRRQKSMKRVKKQFLKGLSFPGSQIEVQHNKLTLNAPIAAKVVCFSRLLESLRSLYGKQCGPRSDCSYRSMLFASLLNSSVMLGNYLQQMISADDIFRCIFYLALEGLNLSV